METDAQKSPEATATSDPEPESMVESYDETESISTPIEPSPVWSRKRSLITGASVGLFFGIIFFTGYGLGSAWICSSRLDCGHWAPITITSVSGAIAFCVLGGIGGLLLQRIYRLFKVV